MKLIYMVYIKIVMILPSVISSDYREHTNNTFNITLFTDRLVTVGTYQESEKFCKSKGGRVVEITREIHQKFVNDFANKFCVNNNSKDLSREFFIGLRRNYSKRDTSFKPVHKTSYPIKNIRSPNNFTNFSAIKNGSLIAKNANASAWVMCAYKHGNYKCSHPYINTTTACYKLMNSTANWYKARNLCAKEGADLVVFDDYFNESNVPLDVSYWIGYSRVKWFWESKPNQFAKFTNWFNDLEDISYSDKVNVCTILKLHSEDKWFPSPCNVTGKIPVVCMKDLWTAEKRSPWIDKKGSNLDEGPNLFLLVGGLVLFLIIGLAFISSTIYLFKRKKNSNKSEKKQKTTIIKTNDKIRNENSEIPETSTYAVVVKHEPSIDNSPFSTSQNSGKSESFEITKLSDGKLEPQPNPKEPNQTVYAALDFTGSNENNKNLGNEKTKDRENSHKISGAKYISILDNNQKEIIYSTVNK